MIASSRHASLALLLSLAACPSGGGGTTEGSSGSSGPGGTSGTSGTTEDPTTDAPTTTSAASTAEGTSSGSGSSGSTTGGPVQPVVLLPRASILPEEVAVLANDQDPQSMEVAAYYLAARQIPAGNLLTFSFAVGDVLGPDVFAGVKAQVDALGPEIQALAVAWTKPYRVDCQSLASALALGYDAAKYCSNPCSETAPSPYFNSTSSAPFTDHAMRLAMHLAGTSTDNVKALIDRGVASDLTAPAGFGYFVRTTDVDRSVRFPSFQATVDAWNKPGLIAMEYRDNSAGMGLDYVEGATDVLFYFTGLASVPAVETNTYLPGAVADHLTSYGGQICESGQMSVCRWLEAGATGSYGTATEPCNYPTKFPETTVLVPHYFRGGTLIEAYWKSVAWPGEGVFVGEPLARPFGGLSVEFDPVTLLLTVYTRELVPGVTYTISSGPSDQGPWTPLGDFSVNVDQVHEVMIPGATEPYYQIARAG